jgi:hypothetical protein
MILAWYILYKSNKTMPLGYSSSLSSRGAMCGTKMGRENEPYSPSEKIYKPARPKIRDWDFREYEGEECDTSRAFRHVKYWNQLSEIFGEFVYYRGIGRVWCRENSSDVQGNKILTSGRCGNTKLNRVGPNVLDVGLQTLSTVCF